MNDIKDLVKDLTGITLASYQVQIVETIVLKKRKKILIKAATQAGKTFAVGVAVALYASMYPNEDILLIAPTKPQAKILIDYVIDAFSKSPTLSKMVSYSYSDIVDKLKAKRRKSEFSLVNGSKICCLSADGALLGYGATLLVLDEAAEIDDEKYRTQIRRMVGGVRASQPIQVLISTPHKRNFFYDEFETESDALKITVSWEDAVREGRLHRDIVEDQRRDMTTEEFRSWYEADFVDAAQNQFFPHSIIYYSKNRPYSKKYHVYYLGVDVARFGKDRCVFTIVGRNLQTQNYEVINIEWLSKSSVNEVVDKIKQLYEVWKPDCVVIDDAASGGGVVDNLRKEGYKIKPFISGRRPRDVKRFANLKAEAYTYIKKLFENKQIKIPDNKFLINDLVKMEFEFTTKGQIRIVDPMNSPDFADSMVMAMYADKISGDTEVFGLNL